MKPRCFRALLLTHLESEEFGLLVKQVKVEGILTVNDVGRGELRRQGAGHRHIQALMQLGEELARKRYIIHSPDPIIAVGTLFGFFKENPTLFDGLSSRLPPTTRPKTPPEAPPGVKGTCKHAALLLVDVVGR